MTNDEWNQLSLEERERRWNAALGAINDFNRDTLRLAICGAVVIIVLILVSLFVRAHW